MLIQIGSLELEIPSTPQASKPRKPRARKPRAPKAPSRYDVALEAIGGLSDPSKMPCLSYSTPADACHLGSLLRKLPGTTCHDCYAMKGCYIFKSTREAMARRLAIVRHMLESPL